MNVNDLGSVCVNEIYRQNLMFLNFRLLYSAERNNCTVSVQTLLHYNAPTLYFSLYTAFFEEVLTKESAQYINKLVSLKD